MAKWGKGDPRWLVEERPDATNVNNWHWSEKNASHWSRNKLSELFVGLKIEADLGNCEITEISKCEGDAVVNNRKGKLIFFYEWNFEMKWRGQHVNGDSAAEGSVAVLNLTEEHDIKDADIIVYFDEDGDIGTYFGNVMQHEGDTIIRQLLAAYVTALKLDFSKDLILPTNYTPVLELATVKNSSNQCKISEQGIVENVPKTDTCDLYSTDTFKCTAEEFFRVLTVKELVQAFTRSECVLEPWEGGKFQIFDGNVQGYFIKLEPFHAIKFKWRFTTWPKDHFSDVTINIDQKLDCTEVKLSQCRVPKEEQKNTTEGWKRHYWDNIKRAFGFGAFLF